MSTRTETDSLGPTELSSEAYYGAQTQRAVENFPASGQRFPRRFIQALGLMKWAAALENEDRGTLEPELSRAIAP